VIPYTEEEWTQLIRQGEPEAGQALGGDLASWRPKVERICAEKVIGSHTRRSTDELAWDEAANFLASR
jgi:hypothetical protein